MICPFSSRPTTYKEFFWQGWHPYFRRIKIYAIADPSHMVKVSSPPLLLPDGKDKGWVQVGRNQVANSGAHKNTRRLMRRGKRISWRHIELAWEVHSAPVSPG